MTTDDELRRGAETALDEFGSGSHGSVGSRPGQGFEEFCCLDWLVEEFCSLDWLRALGQPYLAFNPGLVRDTSAYHGCAELFLRCSKPPIGLNIKRLSDLACHYFSKAGVSTIRRLRKTDNNRIAKACGATIVNRPDELQESDVGTRAGLFEVKKIGDGFFAFVDNCKDPKACTVLLRGASKDLLNEVERNLQDALSVARNILKNPKLLPGGGATELTVSATLKQESQSIEGIEKPRSL
ncbi:hypothetical protein RHMOL_Rhmol12G0170500 [Rhododendron molle]|uniref:Uncharacterized protein n=1 Tax=Rhododendron molle TaxID=49168 RepID=A0ACC0LK46_RHOML|nr:hypothetical protein RHMOL_Rhmol12G0170500 [Rhododendron molle]